MAPIAPTVKVVQPSKLPDLTDLTEVTNGMDVEAFVSAIHAGVQDALGEADIYTAARVLDESVGELLHVMAHVEGPASARFAALRFAETIMPHMGPEQVEAPKTYRQLKQETS